MEHLPNFLSELSSGRFASFKHDDRFLTLFTQFMNFRDVLSMRLVFNTDENFTVFINRFIREKCNLVHFDKRPFLAQTVLIKMTERRGWIPSPLGAIKQHLVVPSSFREWILESEKSKIVPDSKLPPYNFFPLRGIGFDLVKGVQDYTPVIMDTDGKVGGDRVVGYEGSSDYNLKDHIGRKRIFFKFSIAVLSRTSMPISNFNGLYCGRGLYLEKDGDGYSVMNSINSPPWFYCKTPKVIYNINPETLDIRCGLEGVPRRETCKHPLCCYYKPPHPREINTERKDVSLTVPVDYAHVVIPFTSLSYSTFTYLEAPPSLAQLHANHFSRSPLTIEIGRNMINPYFYPEEGGDIINELYSKERKEDFGRYTTGCSCIHWVKITSPGLKLEWIEKEGVYLSRKGNKKLFIRPIDVEYSVPYPRQNEELFRYKEKGEFRDYLLSMKAFR